MKNKELEIVSKEIDKKDKELELIKDNIVLLSSKRESMRIQLSDMENTIDSNNKNIVEIGLAIDNGNKSLSNINKYLEDSEKEIQELKQQIISEDNTMAIKVKKNNDSSKLSKDLSADILKLNDKINNSNNILSNLEVRRNECLNKIKETEKIILNKEREIKRLDHDIYVSNSDLMTVVHAIDDTNSVLSDINDDVNTKKCTVIDKNDEIVKLNNKCNELVIKRDNLILECENSDIYINKNKESFEHEMNMESYKLTVREGDLNALEKRLNIKQKQLREAKSRLELFNNKKAINIII